MSRIKDAFAKGKAFIPFVTCGDPDLDTTAAVVKAMADAGAGIIELGIPFSDPTAEGPVIQGANMRALAGGVTTDRIFDMAAALRRETDVPLVFMTYANVVFSRTVEGFAARCAEAGIDGLILPDVPFEEKEEFAPAFRKRGIDFISLVAPTSAGRIAQIARAAEGFLYVVSSLGVTGTRGAITTDIGAIVGQIRAASDIPCAVGFGISTPEQAARMAALSDGAIVGSAIVKLIAQHGRDAPAAVASYVRRMASAVHAAPPDAP
jgi:tryptophan synthase alpha chain